MLTHKGNLATSLMGQGKNPEAEALHRQVLKVLECDGARASHHARNLAISLLRQRRCCAQCARCRSVCWASSIPARSSPRPNWLDHS